MRFSEKRDQKRVPEKNIIVFYHADCTDGFTAAWVAYKKFGDGADYIAAFYDDVPPKLTKKEIYMLDMSFSEEIVSRLMRDNTRVTIIDHHKSRKEIALMTQNPLYSDKKSGATLAWQYFFPGKSVPQFLKHIEDYDLWRHALKGTKELYAYLSLFDYQFASWSKIIADFEILEKRKQIIQKGKILLEHEMKIVEYNIKNTAVLVRLAGHTVYAINTNYSVSITGSMLYKKQPPFSIMWYQRNDGVIKVSLRSDKTFDCARLAMKYKDGGGHLDAAGFYLVSLKDIPWKVVKLKPPHKVQS